MVFDSWSAAHDRTPWRRSRTASSEALLQTEEAEQRHADRAGEFDRLEVPNPAGARLDAGDREPVDIPALALAPGRKFLLREAELVPDASHLFANEIFPFRHLCVFEHMSLLKLLLFGCARMRNNGVDRAGPVR